MVLREGRYYRTRAGDRVGPIRCTKAGPGSHYPFAWDDDKGQVWTYAPNGTYYADGREDPRDIVDEWVEPRTAENTTPIDLMTLAQFRRGVAKVMGSLSR